MCGGGGWAARLEKLGYGLENLKGQYGKGQKNGGEGGGVMASPLCHLCCNAGSSVMEIGDSRSCDIAICY